MIYNTENFPELPRGWASLTVENSVDSAGNSNKKLKSKDALNHGRFPVIDQGQSDVSGYSDDESLVVEASKLSPVILFGDHTRLLKQISQPFVPGADGTKLFRAKSFWDTRFVYQMLRAIKLPDKGYARHFQYLRNSALPLPPLNEQKRIADKLDAVLARVDACRDRLDRIPAILKRFRQSVLAAATSGKLTEHWRSLKGLGNEVQSVLLREDEIIVPASWNIFSLRDVIDSDRPLCYGVVQPGEERNGGVPLIRVQDMDRGGVLTSALRTVSPDIDAEYKRSRVVGGDLLVSVVGTIGRTAIVPHGLEANIARAIARVACKSGVSNKWVNYWLSSDALQWWLTSSSKEVARKTLNLSDIATVNVAVPSVDEQTEIVRRVESLFAYADRLEARYTAALTQVEKLTPATLAKAFRGELVPQDPSDEPASKLLERIKAQRSDQEKIKPKRSRKVAV